MKVMLINGSCNANGCTFTALSEVSRSLNEEGIETEIIQIGAGAISDCIGCHKCRNEKGTRLNKCIFPNGPVNEIIEKAADCDGFIFGSPVYFAHAAGRMLTVLDRVFYAGADNFKYKPGAAVVSARRAGTTASLVNMEKYFGSANMPIVTSTYWNMVHGNTPEQVRQDTEGMHAMYMLGKNMAWLLKCIENGKKDGIEHPPVTKGPKTNFIR